MSQQGIDYERYCGDGQNTANYFPGKAKPISAGSGTREYAFTRLELEFDD